MAKFKSKPQVDPKALEAFTVGALTRSTEPVPHQDGTSSVPKPHQSGSGTKLVREQYRTSTELVPAPHQHHTDSDQTRTTPVLVPNSYPWEGMDPNAKPTSGINLRLNDYELAKLRELARREDRSIQRTLKRLLLPELERAVGRG